jgi:glutamate 5-kinase
VGQIGLVELYQRRFARHGRKVAQVLVTRVGLEDRERFLNARRTLSTLLRLGVIPVVNENDTVATDEIRFGDNDNLSATVVNLIAADLLVLLTNVDGLLTSAPVPGEPRPPLFEVVEEITPAVLRAARGPGSAFGRGGMTTKIEAARTAARSGCATVVCNGTAKDVVLRVAAGEPVGTLFTAQARLRSRKHWLAFTTRTRGEIVLDDGAVRALRERGRSLLPAGVLAVRGRFRVGDVVACVDQRGAEVARGLVGYSALETERIKGLPTKRISEVLGYSNGDEVIHRDDLVLSSASPDTPITQEPEAGGGKGA